MNMSHKISWERTWALARHEWPDSKSIMARIVKLSVVTILILAICLLFAIKSSAESFSYELMLFFYSIMLFTFGNVTFSFKDEMTPQQRNIRTNEYFFSRSVSKHELFTANIISQILAVIIINIIVFLFVIFSNWYLKTNFSLRMLLVPLICLLNMLFIFSFQARRNWFNSVLILWLLLVYICFLFSLPGFPIALEVGGFWLFVIMFTLGNGFLSWKTCFNFELNIGSTVYNKNQAI